jgi:L-lactate dehydrogenase (cytochrome)
MEGRSTATTMIGEPVAMPVALAPTGLTGMQHADGEIPRRARRGLRRALHAVDHEHLLDRGRGAARRAGLLVPAVRDARPRLHRAPDRPRQGRRLRRAGLTLDLQILGQRHKDIKNGLSTPPKPTLPT